MITLHGFAASNFYNAVKHVLMHKGIPFEEHEIFSGGEEWLSISPVGKVPAITTEDGRHLSESSVICDYLEESYPQVPLYPSEPGARASVRQLMKIAELYLEVPARRLIGYHFSGQSAPEVLEREVRHVIKRGLGAMHRLCKFTPWITGEELTMADIYVHYINAVVGQIGSRELEWDIIGEVKGMRGWRETMKSSEIAQSIETDRLECVPRFQAYLKEYMAKNTK